MTIDDAARILIVGICGPNLVEIARGSGVPRSTVERYLAGLPVRRRADERIRTFVWRRLNAHLLLAPSDRDRRPCVTAPRPRWPSRPAAPTNDLDHADQDPGVELAAD